MVFFSEPSTTLRKMKMKEQFLKISHYTQCAVEFCNPSNVNCDGKV